MSFNRLDSLRASYHGWTSTIRKAKVNETRSVDPSSNPIADNNNEENQPLKVSERGRKGRSLFRSSKTAQNSESSSDPSRGLPPPSPGFRRKQFAASQSQNSSASTTRESSLDRFSSIVDRVKGASKAGQAFSRVMRSGSLRGTNSKAKETNFSQQFAYFEKDETAWLNPSYIDRPRQRWKLGLGRSESLRETVMSASVIRRSNGASPGSPSPASPWSSPETDRRGKAPRFVAL